MTLQQRTADLNVKELQSERRRRLSDLASSVEEKQVYEGGALQAKAAVDAAQEQVAQAEINLKRTEGAQSREWNCHQSLAPRGGLRAGRRHQRFPSSTRTATGLTVISRKPSWPACAWVTAPRQN